MSGNDIKNTIANIPSSHFSSKICLAWLKKYFIPVMYHIYSMLFEVLYDSLFTYNKTKVQIK